MPALAIFSKTFRLSGWLLILLGSAGEAAAQCCFGAHNQSATSKNGMFRVEAISLTGTGREHHGPYRYQFRWSEKIHGEFKPISTFEVQHPTYDHYQMVLHISPAGNGFLVNTTLSPDLVFYYWTGQILRVYQPGELMLERPAPQNETGHFLALVDPKPVPTLQSHLGTNGLNYSRKGEMFLPTAQPVSPELEQALMASIAPPQGESKAVATLIAGMGNDDKAVAELAMRIKLRSTPHCGRVADPCRSFRVGYRRWHSPLEGWQTRNVVVGTLKS